MLCIRCLGKPDRALRSTSRLGTALPGEEMATKVNIRFPNAVCVARTLGRLFQSNVPDQNTEGSRRQLGH